MDIGTVTSINIGGLIGINVGRLCRHSLKGSLAWSTDMFLLLFVVLAPRYWLPAA